MRPGQGSLGAILLSCTVVLATPAFLVGATTQDEPPLKLDVPTPVVGDSVTYVAAWGTRHTFEIGPVVDTRGPVTELHEARLLTETVSQAEGGDEFQRTIAIDPDTGTAIWSQDTWPDEVLSRMYTAYSTPRLYGASVLQGQTLEPGDQIDAPIWDGTLHHTISFIVGDPISEEGRWLWPVSVEASEDIDERPPHLGAIPHIGSQLLMEGDSAYPVSIINETGAILYERSNLNPGSGSAPAWSASTLPSLPPARHPALTFTEVGDGSPPPDTGADPPYAFFEFHEAIKEARRLSSGLGPYLADHPDAQFTRGKPEQSSERDLDLAGVDVESTREFEWRLRWQDRTSGWEILIEKGQEEGLVGDQTDYKIEREGPIGGASTLRLGVIQTSQADLAEVADAIHPRLGDFALDVLTVDRTHERYSWTHQPRFQYRFLYFNETQLEEEREETRREHCLHYPVCPLFTSAGFVPLHPILMDSTTGAIEEIRGPRGLLDSFDEHGFGSFGAG